MHTCLLVPAMLSGDLVDRYTWKDAPPPPGGASVMGKRLAYWHDTEHFSIQWEDPTLDPAVAEEVGVELEAAWDVLVDELDFPAPPSSDAYLLWVILDPELPGTGLTLEQVSPGYPDGYPVSWVNPSYYKDHPELVLSVAVHEMVHQLQYGVRDLLPEPWDLWYWEATAEWLVEVARPDIDAYATSAVYYLDHPELAHDSTVGFHHYGMMLFNAWLDQELGTEVIRDVWLGSSKQSWKDEIAATVGEEPEVLWADFAGAIGSGSLDEHELYGPPVTTDETSGILLGALGTRYVSLGDERASTLDLDGAIGTAIWDDGTTAVFDGALAVGGQMPVMVAVTASSVGPSEYHLDLVGDEAIRPACGCTVRSAEPPLLWWATVLALVVRFRRHAPNG